MYMSEVYADVCKKHDLDINPDVLHLLQHTKINQSTLKLSGSDGQETARRLNDSDIQAISLCLQSNRSITGLDVKYNKITDEGARHIATLLQEENSALSSLDLTGNDIQTDGAQHLAKSLHHNRALLSLRLTANKIGNGGAMFLASMLQVNHTLQEIDLEDCDLDTQSVMAFAIVLNSNTSLRSVNISRPLLFSHQEETAVHLSRMLLLSTTLRELHLAKHQLTDSGLDSLSEGLLANRSVRYLDLRCNRVTQDGARRLATVLCSNGALQVLDLAANRIEDEGAVSLSEAIAGPVCGLRGLCVSSNGIGTVGLLALARALRASNTLTHLYVWGNQLAQPVCQAFRELAACGRLCEDHTDVSAYEVDGTPYLAQVWHGRTRPYQYDGLAPPPATP